MKTFILFLKLSRFYFLVGATLLYLLGTGVAYYLDYLIRWNVFVVGLLWVYMLQLGTHFINELYNADADKDNPNRTPFSGGSGAIGPGKLSKNVVLIAGLSCYAILTSLTILLFSLGGITLALCLIMFAAFIGSFFYSAPPLYLERTGYGEIIASVIVGFLLPIFAFMLQTAVFEHLIALTAFPLFFVHLAMMIIFEYPDYSTDQKHRKNTLLIRIGWQNGVIFHHILLGISYILFLFFSFVGLPLRVLFSAYLTLPFSILQGWQLNRIIKGYRPNWLGLTLNAVVTFGALIYFVALSYITL
jgi:1,4-dihydroxy-2-naphthoate octaprenyltransferase